MPCSRDWGPLDACQSHELAAALGEFVLRPSLAEEGWSARLLSKDAVLGSRVPGPGLPSFLATRAHPRSCRRACSRPRPGSGTAAGSRLASSRPRAASLAGPRPWLGVGQERHPPSQPPHSGPLFEPSPAALETAGRLRGPDPPARRTAASVRSLGHSRHGGDARRQDRNQWGPRGVPVVRPRCHHGVRWRGCRQPGKRRDDTR